MPELSPKAELGRLSRTIGGGSLWSTAREQRRTAGGGGSGSIAAGGYAGNEVQKHVTSKEVWVTKVQMKDGTTRSFEQEAQPAWKSGTIVKVHGKSLAIVAGA